MAAQHVLRTSELVLLKHSMPLTCGPAKLVPLPHNGGVTDLFEIIVYTHIFTLFGVCVFGGEVEQ